MNGNKAGRAQTTRLLQLLNEAKLIAFHWCVFRLAWNNTIYYGGGGLVQRWSAVRVTTSRTLLPARFKDGNAM